MRPYAADHALWFWFDFGAIYLLNHSFTYLLNIGNDVAKMY